MTFQWSDEAREAAEREIGRCERPTPSGVRAFVAADAVLALLRPVVQQALDEARLDERELLSARVYGNGWCPTCAAPVDAHAHGRKLAEAAEAYFEARDFGTTEDCDKARSALYRAAADSPWGDER